MLQTTLQEKALKLVPVEAIFDINQEAEVLSDDPLMDLMNEFSGLEIKTADTEYMMSQKIQVTSEMSDEQMWLTLNNQLRGMTESVNRLRYFLTEIDDSVRR